MYLQETTPDTTNFLILGFITFAVFGGGFIVSLVVRFRNLRRDAVLIEQLQEEDG